jgi:tRNA modification GTPase
MYEDTISAIATPHGVGAISIIRVSGDKALEVGAKVCNLEQNSFKPRYAHLKTLYDKSGKEIDKAIVIYFPAPNSFTGEDIFEFQIHGGVVLSQMVLETTLYFGSRLARGGEFSKRAFLNGKVDLSEAEAIGKIIEAKSEEAVHQLSKQLHGELRTLTDRIRSELLNILAHSEVTIDYAEEDLPSDIEETIEEKLEDLEAELQNLLKSSKTRNRIFEGFKISIIGRPNVGKSSLLNSLLNYERAIVSNIAGTTRDSVEEYLTVGTHLVKIVDTAGIRESGDEVEKIGIERSLKAISESDIVLALFDSSEKLQVEDFQILKTLEKEDREILVVFSKSDLKREIEEISGFDSVSVSKKETFKLLEKLEEILNSQNISSEGGVILSSLKQIEEVENGVSNILEAKEFLKSGELELFSLHIESAIQNISSISKPYEYSEMLDEMFGSFCLGK